MDPDEVIAAAMADPWRELSPYPDGRGGRGVQNVLTGITRPGWMNRHPETGELLSMAIEELPGDKPAEMNLPPCCKVYGNGDALDTWPAPAAPYPKVPEGYPSLLGAV